MARKKKTLRDALTVLDAEESLQGIDLELFSDLGDSDVEQVEARWPDWPVRLRRGLLIAATELAEQNFTVNFDAVARLGLDDPDAEVRVAAVAALWESEDLDLIAAFMGIMLNDPARDVRAEAAKNLGRYVYLGECGDLLQSRARRVEDTLLAVLAGADDVAVRRRALESVAYSGRAEVAPIIEAAYRNEDSAWRASALFAMGRNLDERWASIVQAEMDSPDAEMRYEAARAAGELELKGVVPILAKLTLDTDKDVQGAAIWSLGQIGGDQAAAALHMRRRTANAELREAIDDALAIADLENLGFSLMAMADEVDDDEDASGIVLN